MIKMFSNVFFSMGQIQGIAARQYSLDGFPDSSKKYALIKGLESRLINWGLAYAATNVGDNVYFIPKKPPKKEQQIGNYKWLLGEKTIALNPNEHTAIIYGLLKSAFKQRAHEMDYLGPQAGEFYKNKPYKKGFFEYHNSFYFDLDLHKDGKAGIWIDPSTKWKWTLQNYFSTFDDLDKSRDQIKDFLVGRDAFCPSPKGSYFRAEILDVVFDSVSKVTFKDNFGEKTVYDFWNTSEEYKKWMERHNFELKAEDRPVIKVQYPSSELMLFYPAKFLELVINLDKSGIPAEALEEKKKYSPADRVQETLKLAKELLEKPIELGETKIDFSKELANWYDNKQYAELMFLETPSLKFGKDKVLAPVSKYDDPKVLGALKESGPITTKPEVKLTFIAEDSLPEKTINSFIEGLNKAGAQMGLAKFSLKRFLQVKSDKDSYYIKCGELEVEENEIIIVVLPRANETGTYFFAKRGLGQKELISKMIRRKTLEECAGNSNKDMKLSIFGMNVFERSLQPGEAVWILDKPAGNVNPEKTIYFMGFDVSREPKQNKEAAAYAAICDSYGRILQKKQLSHKGEKIHSSTLSDWFFEVAYSAFTENKASERKQIDEIMLFKDGPIFASQIDEYKEGALDAKNRLVKQGIMKEESNITIISVVKKGAHRIYGTKEYGYKAKSVALLKNKKQAIAATASTYIGTPATVRINIDFQLKEDKGIKEILKIFNDLRFLDWSSLFKQPKTILPLHIVQNLAKLSKEDIIVPYIPR